MISPLELALKPLKLSRNEAVDYLINYRREVEAIINTSLSKDPEKIWNTYYMKIRSIRKSFKELCYEMGEGRICLYQYKEVSAKNYFRTPLLSAMRGAVIEWYDNGDSKLLAFPFAKFFNYGEVDETSSIPRDDFIATEKLDGTLIVAWRSETGELHFNTRGLLEWYGITKGKSGIYRYKSDKIANPYVLAFVNAVKRMGLWYELESLVKDKATVMFELTGRIPASQAARAFMEEYLKPDDPAWKPYALAMRDNKTFKLRYINESAFPIPKKFTAGFDELYEFVRSWKDREGIVLFFPDKFYREGDLFKWWNYMVKLKSPKYVLRTEIFLGDRFWWKGIARAVILGYHDDVVSIANNQEVKEFADTILNIYAEMRDTWENIIEVLKSKGLDNAKRNYISVNLKAKWILPYIEEGTKRGESALRKLLITSLPSKKESVVSFMRRINNKIAGIEKSLK